MKKIVILLALLMILPLGVSAKTINLNEYNTTDLKQALLQEGIEPSFDKLKENDKQVTIYLFRGNGCPHCIEFLEFLNKIYAGEGDKFKVVSFAVSFGTYRDEKNDSLQTEVARFEGIENPDRVGVPLIIIGDQYFSGFAEKSHGDAVLSAINSEYKKDVDDRYDVFVEMGKEKEANPLGVGGAVIITILGVAAVIIYDTIRFNKLQDEIRLLKKNK